MSLSFSHENEMMGHKTARQCVCWRTCNTLQEPLQIQSFTFRDRLSELPRMLPIESTDIGVAVKVFLPPFD